MRIFSSNRYSVVTSTLALVIALGGTSYAAAKITGDSIVDGTVTTADVKDQTLNVADLATATRDALKGDTGPAGPAGPAGPSGVSSAYTTQVTHLVELSYSPAQDILTLPLGPGYYVVSAKANVQGTKAGDWASCSLIDHSEISFDRSQTDVSHSDDDQGVYVQAAVELDAAGEVKLRCNGVGTWVHRLSMTAIQVDSVTRVSAG